MYLVMPKLELVGGDGNIIGTKASSKESHKEYVYALRKVYKACKFSVGRGLDVDVERIFTKDMESFIRERISRKEFSVLEFADITVQMVVSRKISHEIVRHRHGSFVQESTRWINYEAREGWGIPYLLPVWWFHPLFKINPHFSMDWSGSDKTLRFKDLIGVALQDEPIDFYAQTPKQELLYDENKDLLNLFVHWYNVLLQADRGYSSSFNVWNKLGLENVGEINFRSTDFAGEFIPNATACQIIVKMNIRSWREYLEKRVDPRVYPGHAFYAAKLSEFLQHNYPAFFKDMEFSGDLLGDDFLDIVYKY